MAGKKDKRSHGVLKTLSVVILLALCASLYSYACTNPWVRGLTLSYPYMAIQGDDGARYVVDDGTTRLVKLSPDGNVDFSIVGQGRGEAGFFNLYDMTVADDGSLYLHDVTWSESGVLVSMERVLHYDAHGKLIASEYQLGNMEGEPDVRYNKRHILALRFADGRWLAARTQGDEVELFDAKGRIAGFAFADAYNMLQDAAIDPRDGTVYVVDKRGTVWRGESGGFVSMYESKSGETLDAFSLAYSIDVSPDGTVYVSDIGRGQVIRLLEGGNTEAVLYSTGFSAVTAVGSLAVADGDGACFAGWAGENAEYVYSADYQPLYRALRWAAFILYACAAVLLLVLVGFFLLSRVKRGISNVQRTNILVAFAILVVSMLIAPSLIMNSQSDSVQQSLNHLASLVQVVSDDLDTEALVNVKTPQDYAGDDYNKLFAGLERSLDKRYAWNKGLYATLYKVENGQVYAIGYLDHSVGAYYPFGDFEGSDQASAEAEGIIVRDNVSDTTGDFLYAMCPVRNAEGETLTYLEIGMDAYAIRAQSRERAITAVVNTVLSIIILLFFLTELIAALELTRAPKLGTDAPPVTAFLRPGIFMTYLVYNMATGFLPVYAARFSSDLWGLPAIVVAAVPVALNQIGTALGAAVTGAALRKLKPSVIVISALILGVAGNLLAAFATILPDTGFWALSVGLMLAGLSVGVLVGFANGFIASQPGEDAKADGFSMFNASSTAGVNCGMLTGALLAVSLGQATVFYVTAGLFVATCALMIPFIKVNARRGTAIVVPPNGQKRGGALRLLFSPKVLGFFILAFLPYFINNSFLFYFFPLYGNSMGLNESLISLILVLHGICVIYVGPSLTRSLLGKLGRFVLPTASLISILAVVIFALMPKIATMLIAVALLGISNSFGYTAYSVNYSSLVTERGYDPGKAMGVYTLFENVAEATGPMLFSTLMLVGITTGFMGFALASAGGAALYSLLFLLRKRKTPDEGSERA